MASSLWQGGFNHEGLDAKGKMINPTEAFAGIGGTGGASMIVFGTIAGGAGAALTGGNFWQGAATGLIVSGLNHYEHQMDSKSMETGDNGGCTDCPKKASVSSMHNSSDGNLYSYGLDGGWHLLGPSLVGLGAPMTLFKPLGALGSEAGSSIASYVLTKALPQTTKFALKSLSITKSGAFRITNTTIVGRFAGRWVPFVGWGLMAYDFTTYVGIPMMQGFQANRAYNQATGNWIANIPH